MLVQQLPTLEVVTPGDVPVDMTNHISINGGAGTTLL